MIISFETIKEICKRHECDDLYFYENIPPKKLRNARESFKIPKTSAIIALYDNTIFGSCKDGLAICSDGLYWRHASDYSNVILWDDLDSVCFNTKDHYLILNNFYNIDIYGDYRSKMLAEFLLDIKDHIYKDSAPKEIVLKSVENVEISINILKEICEKYMAMDTYLTNDIPLTTLNKLRASLGINNYKKLIALYNMNTVDFKEGFAICHDGIYLKNSRNTILISWEDILTMDIDYDSTAIVLNKYYNIYCSRNDFKVLSNLFLEINDYLNQTYISKIISQKTSKKRILEPNKTKQIKNESDKNTPKSTSSKASIGILENNQPKNKLININNVPLDQLLTLPYFTLERAEKVLSERQNSVIFTSLDDIIGVLNLKPHEAETLKEYLSFETSNLNKNTADHEVVKKSEEIINDNINTPIKGRIVDF